MNARIVLTASLIAIASAGANAATTLEGPGLVSLTDTESSVAIQEFGNFSDIWLLVVDETDGAADVDISVSDVHGTLLGYSINIDGLTVTGDPGFTGGNDSWNFSGQLANGSYDFTIGGNATGDNTVGNLSIGGAYSISLNATNVAPIPLPPAALLFGSALVGLAGLRRRKRAEAENS